MLTPDISSRIGSGTTANSLHAAAAVQSQKDTAAKQVESMFAAVLIKTMRQTLGETGLFPGDSADILGSLFDQHMADQISADGGLGVADAFRSQL